MLRRLEIHSLRNVQRGTVLHFHEGINVLLGLNASGKTTLLELVAAILRGDFSSVPAFDLTFDLEHDGAHLVVNCGGHSEWLEDDHQELETIAEHLNAYGYDRTGALVGEIHLDGVAWWVERAGERVQSPLPDDLWSKLVDHVTAAVWPASATRPRFADPACHRVDESLTRFHEMHGDSGDATASLRATWRNGDAAVIDGRNIVPDLIECARQKLSHGPSQLSGIEVNHTESTFLAEAARWLDFSGCIWRASLLQQARAGHRVVATYARFSFGFLRSDRGFFTDDILSYGQKRLLALLYHLRNHQGTFVADELVNGLHHAWIERLMDDLAGRQVFVSTQNPVLLDHLTFESARDVQQTFVFCRRHGSSADHEGVLVWESLSDDDARAFFEAYQVGIQHVSDLLRTRGFW